MAMSKEHRDALIKNRVAIVKDMNVGEELLSHLMSTHIITEDMKDQIDMPGTTRQQKVSRILQTIPTRGAKAFPELIHALVITHQEHIAKILDPALTRHFQEVEERELHEPTCTMEVDSGAPRSTVKDIPVEEKVLEIRGNKDIVASVIQMSDADRSSKLARYDVYKVKGSSRGRAVIVSNQHFTDSKLTARFGNDADVMNLKKLLESLHFDVDTWTDRTDQQISKLLEEEQIRPEHKNADMFMMFVLSHGEDGHFYALNGGKINIEEIVNSFGGDKCPDLRNKPKLFFIQACQGAGKTKGYPRPVSEHDGTVTDSLSEPAAAAAGDHVDAVVHKSASTESINIDKLVHEKADVLVARSTVSGYVALRHVDYGSQFIRCLVYVFSRKAHVAHVNDMMIEVNHIMSQFRNAGDDIQIGETRGTLTKYVYFMP